MASFPTIPYEIRLVLIICTSGTDFFQNRKIQFYAWPFGFYIATVLQDSAECVKRATEVRKG